MWEQLWQWFLVPANQTLCLSIIVAFIVGLLIGRLTRSIKEKKVASLTKEGDRAFFKGFQYILSNDQDLAIEEFSKSVQVNSDTVETYVALGNLYRSKGDIDRAIRVRQNIILRQDIDQLIKIRAILDLGLDYRKGGFLNRALVTFLEVTQKDPKNLLALEEIEKIYEEMKDWENAFITRQKIAGLSDGDHKHILAHQQTELGKIYQDEGELPRAKTCFKKAISIDGQCVDPYLHLGDLYFSQQEYKKAISTWKKVVKIAPRFTFLAYRRLEGAYSKMKNLKPVEDFLEESARLNSDAFTHLALARYLYNKEDFSGTIKELESALELDPSFWEARTFLGEILLRQGMKEKALAAYKELISHLNVPYLEFQCTNCGFRPDQLLWQCPQCKKWDTIDFTEFRTVHTTSIQKNQTQSPDLLKEKSREDA